MPRFEIQSSYTRTDNPMLAFGSILNQRAFSPSLNFNNVPDVDNLNARGVVTVPLYAGGRNVAGRKSARAQSEAAKQESAAVRNALGFEVARAFHSVIKTREFVRATEADVHAFESHLVVAGKRFEAGTLLKSDVLNVDIRLAQAKEDLVRATHASKLAQRALRNLLGMDEGELIPAESAPLQSAPASGDFTQRPEIAAARERLNAAQAQVRESRSGFLPRVNAFGSIDYNVGWVTDGDNTSYTAGILVQWELWDGFSTLARTREAAANLEMSREEQRRLNLALDFEFEQAWLNYQAATERLHVTEKTIEQATESARLTRHRFEEGLALATQIIDAETALVATRVRRAEAESDLKIAVAALRKALAWPQIDNQTSAP